MPDSPFTAKSSWLYQTIAHSVVQEGLHLYATPSEWQDPSYLSLRFNAPNETCTPPYSWKLPTKFSLLDLLRLKTQVKRPQASDWLPNSVSLRVKDRLSAREGIPRQGEPVKSSTNKSTRTSYSHLKCSRRNVCTSDAMPITYVERRWPRLLK